MPKHGRHPGGGQNAPSVLRQPIEQWLPERFSARKDAPLALYLHVPFCRHRCAFCPFYQNRSEPGFSREYADLLVEEIGLLCRSLGSATRERTVWAVYFGGGTPGDLDATDLTRVLHALRETFLIAEDAEVTVEGRVRDFSADKAQAWVEAGANRFSVGLQCTDVTLRRRLGRLANADEIAGVLTGLKSTGAILIVDLIFGLPGQTAEMLLNDLDFLTSETPIDGLDLYELIEFPNSPLARQTQDGRLPPLPQRRQRAAMYGAGSRSLATYGFEHFTPQHWRRTRRERSRYNHLAKADADTLPIGASAGGNLGSIALRKERDLTAYTEAIRQGRYPVTGFESPSPPTDEDRFKLRLAEAIEARQLPPPNHWPATTNPWRETLLSNWQQGGLLEAKPKGGTPQLTTAGSYWSRHLSTLLHRCLAAKASAFQG